MSKSLIRFGAALALAVATAVGILLAVARLTEEGEIRGVLVDVQSRDILNAEAVTVREDTGVLHTFRVSPQVAHDPDHSTSASHLRQHLAAVDPVIIRYRQTLEHRLRGEHPWAVRIKDASQSP